MSGLRTIDIESAVMPAHHVVDDKNGDHAFFFEPLAFKSLTIRYKNSFRIKEKR